MGAYNNKNQAFSSGTIDTTKVTLPIPPESTDDKKFEMAVYARFMGHLRQVPNSRMEIKILSSIRFTADVMDTGDALVSKILIDLGLRAPRKAFPVTFLDFVDKSIARKAWDYGSPALSVLALKEHWDKIGEDCFNSDLRTQYAIFNESRYVTQ